MTVEKGMRRFVLQLFNDCICDTWLKICIPIFTYNGSHFKTLDFIMNEQIRQQIDIHRRNYVRFFFIEI